MEDELRAVVEKYSDEIAKEAAQIYLENPSVGELKLGAFLRRRFIESGESIFKETSPNYYNNMAHYLIKSLENQR